MIVVDVSAQDSPEVSLVEDDHVIETLAPNASNDPFDVGALPRGARRRRNLLDVESRNAPWRCCTARSKSLTSLCRLQSHPAQYVSGIPSAAILLSISHPIRCSTRCLANVRARISGPMIAL